MTKARTIIIHDVGMRDGLQMEKQVVPTATKIEWIGRLASAGVDIIQVGSFVNPSKVPQMADTDQLFAELTKRAGANGHTIFSGLVLNEKGLERGLAFGVRMFCMGVSASETHSMKNTGMSIAEATKRITAIARLAAGEGCKVQLSVQSAFGCGYEGDVPRERVMGLVRTFVDAGFHSISLADTAGHATPGAVEEMFAGVFAIDAGAECACHFHNTYGLGLANCFSALRAGVTSFESSIAGLGGCPFTKIAGGNVCTEDLVHAFQRMGLRSDVDLAELIAAAQDVAGFFGRELPGMVYRSGPIPSGSTLHPSNEHA